MSTDREKALDVALAAIDKQFGKGSIMRMGEKGSMAIEAVQTGALALDVALGVGGLPRGRVVEIYGPESSGKSTLAMHVVAEAQRNGGICAYIDAEHAMDPVYAKAIGVDIDQLPGLQARLMSQALRKLTASINRSHTMVIFINQIRMKIGVMFGSPETTTGGNALKFYSSVRLDIRRIGSIKDRDEVVGNQTRVKVVKNKLAPPFKQVEFDIMYGEGISKTGELIDLGVKAGIVEKSGAWFSFDSQRLGQGRENAKLFLKENPETAVQIEQAIRQAAGLIAGQFLEDTGPEDDDEPDDALEA